MTLSTERDKVELLNRGKFRLETFLEQNRICYLEKKGIISRNVREPSGAEYTIFITDKQGRVDSFDIVLGCQEDLKATKENKSGYLIAKIKDMYGTYSPKESVNTIYCSYILNQDTMIFKPLRMMLNWLKKNINCNTGNKHINKLAYIRVKPKEVEKHAGGYNGYYSYYLGKHATSLLEHKEPFVIRPKELETFFSESNKYPKMWKLKFKTMKNILDQGV